MLLGDYLCAKIKALKALMSQDRAFLMDYTSFEGVEAQRPHLLARHLSILVNEVWPLCLNPVKYNVGPLCYNPVKKVWLLCRNASDEAMASAPESL